MLHQATSRDGDGMDDTEKIKEPNQSIRMEQKIQGFMPVEFCQNLAVHRPLDPVIPIGA